MERMLFVGPPPPPGHRMLAAHYRRYKEGIVLPGENQIEQETKIYIQEAVPAPQISFVDHFGQASPWHGRAEWFGAPEGDGLKIWFRWDGDITKRLRQHLVFRVHGTPNVFMGIDGRFRPIRLEFYAHKQWLDGQWVNV